jgi:hypothetical protein
MKEAGFPNRNFTVTILVKVCDKTVFLPEKFPKSINPSTWFDVTSS